LVARFSRFARQDLVALVPVLGPALYFFLFLAVAFLNDAEEFIVVALRFEQIVVCKLAPLLFDLAFELLPTSFELLFVHENASLPSMPEFACF